MDIRDDGDPIGGFRGLWNASIIMVTLVVLFAAWWHGGLVWALLGIILGAALFRGFSFNPEA